LASCFAEIDRFFYHLSRMPGMAVYFVCFSSASMVSSMQGRDGVCLNVAIVRMVVSIRLASAMQSCTLCMSSSFFGAESLVRCFGYHKVFNIEVYYTLSYSCACKVFTTMAGQGSRRLCLRQSLSSGVHLFLGGHPVGSSIR
jgi:hypothetical protein